MKLCHGRKTCTVDAEEYVFGDPCPMGVNKYLNVIYTCGKIMTATVAVINFLF